MPAALETKSIDGYATSLPFTTQAVLAGSAIMLASAVRDAPDLLPFAYGLVYTRAGHLHQAARQMRAGGARARRRQRLHPRQAGRGARALKKRFDKMDPAVLAAAWRIVAQAHAKDVRVTVPGLENSQKVSLEAKLLGAEGRARRNSTGFIRMSSCADRAVGDDWRRSVPSPACGGGTGRGHTSNSCA